MEKEEITQSQIGTTIITDLNFLKMVSKETSRKEIEERKLVHLIKYALNKAWTFGYGLAAIQVGIPIAAAWYWLPGERNSYKGEGHLLINPKIIEMSEPIIKPGEGCLSIPNRMFTTKRYNQITLINEDRKCVAEGLEAQIIQHEVDHLRGILVSDREYKSDPIGRNDTCPCGSGKKYKKCCLGKAPL